MFALPSDNADKFVSLTACSSFIRYAVVNESYL